MKVLLRRFLRNESGATAIEYGLLVACVGMAAIFAMNAFSAELFNVYVNVDNAIVEADNSL